MTQTTINTTAKGKGQKVIVTFVHDNQVKLAKGYMINSTIDEIILLSLTGSATKTISRSTIKRIDAKR